MNKWEKVLMAYYLGHYAGMRESGLGTKLVVSYYKVGSAHCQTLMDHSRRLHNELKGTKVLYLDKP